MAKKENVAGQENCRAGVPDTCHIEMAGLRADLPYISTDYKLFG